MSPITRLLIVIIPTFAVIVVGKMFLDRLHEKETRRPLSKEQLKRIRHLNHCKECQEDDQRRRTQAAVAAAAACIISG